MSFATLERQNAPTVELFRPRYGQWWADVETDNPTLLTGDVSLVVGDLTLAGAIERGGISGGIGRYRVRGGLAWSTLVPAVSYHADSGVRLRTVLADLARDAGASLARARGASETAALAAGNELVGRLDYPTDIPLGASVLRPAGLAREALARLREHRLIPPWYASDAGRTVFAVRSPGALTAPRTPARRNTARGVLWTAVDAVAWASPGGTLEGATVDSVTVRVGSTVVVETVAERL